MKSIIGQSLAKSQIEKILSGDRGHVFLITGASGIGKKTFARKLAKGLLCQSPDIDGACGICTLCRYFDENVNPDFKSLTIPSGERGIKVESVRSGICADVSVLPQFSSKKVYLIEGDGLNEQGQNALLKTLEEPPPGVYFLITGKDTSLFLPTIISRSQVIPLYPNSEDEVISVLKSKLDISEEEAVLYARFSEGIPGRAIELASSEWFKDLRDESANIFFRIPKLTKTTLLTEIYRFFEDRKENTNEILIIWQFLLRDLLFLKFKQDKNKLRNTDFSLDINKVMGLWTEEQIENAGAVLIRCFAALKANCSFESSICSMLLTFHKS